MVRRPGAQARRALKLGPRLLAALLAACGATIAQAGSLQFCDRPSTLTARDQDRLLQFAAAVLAELDAAPGAAALVSRSGLDLSRFGLRYSHAGISLKGSANGPWSVRQLYYACDEGRPRLYDQGLPGFVFGTGDARLGYVSIMLLPAADAEPLARAALDDALATSLLAGSYSANAYPFSERYQNCNQWVAELLAAGAGALDAQAGPARPRERAQLWLAAQGYEPQAVDIGSHLLKFAGQFIPWVHFDDQPEADRYTLRAQVSVPDAIERFVRRRMPEARRIELCHDERRVVIRHGWAPIGDGCSPAPGDRVVALD